MINRKKFKRWCIITLAAIVVGGIIISCLCGGVIDLTKIFAK